MKSQPEHIWTPASSDVHPDEVADKAGATGILCDWTAKLRLEDVPTEVVGRAKHLLLDGLGCGIVASHLPWSKLAVEAMSSFEEGGSCTVMGYEHKMSPLSATLLNSSFIQGFEIDDWHYGAPCHSASIIIPAILAATEVLKKQGKIVSGKDFLLAAIVGFEVSPRIGLGLGGSALLDRGIHSGTLMGHQGSAAASSKLLGLTPRQTEHAVGFASTQACGLQSAQFGSMGKRMQHGFASRNGLFGALMSRGGYTGIERSLELPYGGFYAVWGQGSPVVDIDRVVRGLGTEWDQKNIKIKAYCSQAANHTMIDCIAKLQANNLEKFKDLSKLKNLHIEMASYTAFSHGCYRCPKPPVEVTLAQMCAPYAAAVQLLDYDVFMKSFHVDKLYRPELWDLMDKMTYAHSPHMDPEKKSLLATKVTATFDDGFEDSIFLEACKGALPPLTNDEVVQKWTKMADATIGAELKKDIESLILALEEVKDISMLGQLLGQEMKSPLTGKA